MQNSTKRDPLAVRLAEGAMEAHKQRKMTPEQLAAYRAEKAAKETDAPTPDTPYPGDGRFVGDSEPSAAAPEGEVCPGCGEVHEAVPESLAELLSSFAPRKSTKVFSGHPVEVAADIIGQLRLSPRDLVTLASALLCTVVERSHDDWGKHGNPFGHIDYDMDTPGNTPFKVGIGCLQVVESWADFTPPNADPVAH